jgi:hypothetical protein
MTDAGSYTFVATLGPDSIESYPGLLTVLASPSQSYSNVVTADRPVAWWRLDDPAGSTVAAEVNGLYPGIIQPDVKLGLEGALLGDADSAAGFTGYSSGARTAQSRIEVGFTPDLNPPVFSVECWAMVRGGAGSYRSPLTSRDTAGGSASYGYLFYAGADDHWQFWLGTGANWSTFSGPAVAENQWTHLVGTFDGANAAFYVNGALVNTGPAAYSPNLLNGLFIGAGATETWSGSYYFPGRIDEVAIYTNVLSADQVGAHYAAAFPAAAAPRFTLQPFAVTTLANDSAALSATVHSTPPVSYQWQHNGTNLPGATDATLAISPARHAGAGTYQLIARHDTNLVSSVPATLSVLFGEAVSVHFEGFEGYRTINSNGGRAGCIALSNWNEIAYNSNSGSLSNLIDNQGQTNGLVVSWTAGNSRRWNGPFAEPAADYALFNGFLEAAYGTNITLTLDHIPAAYQQAGYSLYVYLAGPSAAAGAVTAADSFGLVSLGSVTNYYHTLDLALWDGSFLPATTTDALEPAPADANYVVFTNLNASSLTVTVAPHPTLPGPVGLSGFQLVANVINPVPLAISQSGSGLTLSWEGDWVLQQKTTLDNDPSSWTDVPGAVSPYSIPMPLPGQQFYRLRAP